MGYSLWVLLCFAATRRQLTESKMVPQGGGVDEERDAHTWIFQDCEVEDSEKRLRRSMGNGFKC